MTATDYPQVAWSDVLKERRDDVVVEPDGVYPLVGIYSWGKGLFRRAPIRGAETKYRRLTRLHEGQLVFSRLNGWEGALAVVQDGFAGTYVSQEYPTFDLRPGVEPDYIAWLCRWPRLWSALHPRGSMVRRKRTHPDRLLELRLPLPPIAEQRRISDRLAALVGAAEEALRLRHDSSREVGTIFDSALAHLWRDTANWQNEPIEALAKIATGHVDPTLEPFAGMPHISGASIEAVTCRLLPFRSAREDAVTSGKFRFQAGAVLYSKIRPYLRKATQVTFEGISSADVYPFVSFDDRIAPRFFMYSLVAPPFTTYANAISGRTRMPKLNQDQIGRFRLAFPDRYQQEAIIRTLDQLADSVAELRAAQQATAGELDAIVPAILDRALAGTR